MPETLIADVESDGFLHQMTRLWTIQLGTAAGDDVTVYADQPGFPPLQEAVNRLAAAEHYVFHNGIGFDRDAINRFYPGLIEHPKLLDTLVMARLAYPERKNHSLKFWGIELGVHKGDFGGDFTTFTPELVTYAAGDIVTGRALYNKVKHVREWGVSCDLEHRVSYALRCQELHGFHFNVKSAEQLDLKLRAEMDKVNADLQRAFPPIDHEETRIMLATNKKFGYIKGQPFTKKWTETFNPGSRIETGKRLIAMGWKPTKFGDDGHPSVDEATLGLIKNPIARPLLAYFKVQKKLGMLSDGKNGWLKLVGPDGRIHGRVNNNGARTGRMTHSKPNMAQVDKSHEMRELFDVAPGRKLVGCDGEGIQLRVLAHYLHKYDGGKMADRIVSGNKKERTDPHSANLHALVNAGVLHKSFWNENFNEGRDGAKTTIYAKLFGSSPGGLGRTIQGVYRGSDILPPKMPRTELGALVNVALSRAMVGLDKLEEAAGARLKKVGYLVGLDGRRIFSNQARLALVTLCQGGEAAIMKQALSIFHWEKTVAAGIKHGVDFGYCANVHDEVQFEVFHPDMADTIGLMFAGCITEAGERLGFKCPLAGLHQVGNNWAETH